MRPGSIVALVFAGSAATGVGLVALTAAQPANGARASSSASAALPSDQAGPASTDAAPEVASTLEAAEPTASSASPARAAAPMVGSSGACPDDMVLVAGAYCPFPAHKCKVRRPASEACESYENLVMCESATIRTRVCMDRFEYPNREGALAAVLTSYEEAARACAAEDKRLCTIQEWQLACEGEDVLPFSTGLSRERATCAVDLGADAVVSPTIGPAVARHLAERDHRQPIGSFPSCASPFGVRDLGGGVAEWATNPVGSMKRSPFMSVVAGGSYGAGPTECRASSERAPRERGASLGFRCCSEVSPSAAVSEMSRPRHPSSRSFRPIVPGGAP
ncbi:MAG: SUMF1/EgtB/PvdO family nonheme iron enzyme [Polyangiaceae bacterium]